MKSINLYLACIALFFTGYTSNAQSTAHLMGKINEPVPDSIRIVYHKTQIAGSPYVSYFIKPDKDGTFSAEIPVMQGVFVNMLMSNDGKGFSSYVSPGDTAFVSRYRWNNDSTDIVFGKNAAFTNFMQAYDGYFGDRGTHLWENISAMDDAAFNQYMKEEKQLRMQYLDISGYKLSAEGKEMAREMIYYEWLNKAMDYPSMRHRAFAIMPDAFYEQYLTPADTGEQNLRYPTFMSLDADKVVLGSANNVSFEGERNYIYLIDRATGKQDWELTLPEGKSVTGKIWMSGNTMLVPMGNLVALDAATAKVLWQLNMSDLTRGAGDPVMAGNNVLVNGAVKVGLGRRLFCLDAATGNERWHIDAGMDVVGRFTPTVIDNKYVLGVYEKGTDIRANGRPFLARIDNGEKIWENDDIGMHTDATYANGKLYFFGQDLSGLDVNVGLICLDAASGKREWINTELNGLVNKEPLVIADNGIFRAPGLH